MNKKKTLVLAATLAAVAMPVAADYIYRVPLLSTYSGGFNSGGSFTPPPGVEIQDGSEPGTCSKTKEELDTFTNADITFKYFLSDGWSWLCKHGIYVTTTKPMLFHADKDHVTAIYSKTVKPEGGYFWTSMTNPDGPSFMDRVGVVSYSLCDVYHDFCGTKGKSGTHLTTSLHGLYDPMVSSEIHLWTTESGDSDPLIVPATPASFSMHEAPNVTFDWPAITPFIGEEVELTGGVHVRQTISDQTISVDRTFDNGSTFEDGAGSVRFASGTYYYTPGPSDKGARLRMRVDLIDQYNMPFNDLTSPLSQEVGEMFAVQSDLMYVGVTYDEGGFEFPIVVGGSGVFTVAVSNPPAIPGIDIENGYLNGTPTTAGVYNIPFTAEDIVSGETISSTFALEIEEVTPLHFMAYIPGGDIRLNLNNLGPRPINFNIGGQGGVGDISYTLAESLPGGLSFNQSTGQFSGALDAATFSSYTPQFGPYYEVATVTAEDELGTRITKSVRFSVCIGTGNSTCPNRFGDGLEENDPTGKGPTIGTTKTGSHSFNLTGAGLTAPFDAISASVNGSSCNRTMSFWEDSIDFCTKFSDQNKLSFNPATGALSYDAKTDFSSRRDDNVEMLLEGNNGKQAKVVFTIRVPRSSF